MCDCRGEKGAMQRVSAKLSPDRPVPENEVGIRVGKGMCHWKFLREPLIILSYKLHGRKIDLAAQLCREI